MQFLNKIDLFLFSLINQSWTHPVLDRFFPIWTDFHKTELFKFIFLPLLLLTIFWKMRSRGLIFVFFLLIGLGINDGIWGKFVKPAVERHRPGNAGIEVIVRAPYGGYSFPSNHAANMFFLTTFVGFYFPRWRWPLGIMAALTAYSRVYCGVHFPSDVIGGALLGSSLGLGIAFLFRPFWGRLQERLSRARRS